MPTSDNRQLSIALLILRVGIGLTMCVAHGIGKINGDPESWARLGANGVRWLGIEFGLVAFGLAAALAESLGALLVAAGLLTRAAAVWRGLTMRMAMMFHIDRGDPFSRASHALELTIVFSVIAMLGPGRFSIDAWLAARKSQAS